MQAIPISLHTRHLTHTVQYGAGFNWFDFLGMGGSYAYAGAHYDLSDPAYPELDDVEGWRLVIEQLDLMRPGFIRFGLPPNPHCDASGAFQGGTLYLERLRRIDAWAARSGCVLMLDTFLLPEWHVFPADEAARAARPSGMFQYLARDNRDLARRFLAPMLRHVVQDLGLTSVGWFNVINEPFCYGVGETPGNEPDALPHYAAMYRELRAALDDVGVPRSRLRLAGGDLIYFFARDKMLRLLRDERFGEVVDGISVHYYHLFPDNAAWALSDHKDGKFWARMDLQIEGHTRELADWCQIAGLPLMATEIGTFCYGFRVNPEGAASFIAQLTIVEAMLRMLNTGISTFGYWSLMNPNTIDGHWRTFRLHGPEGGREARYTEHVGPLRAIMSQMLRPGATIVPVESSYPAGAWRSVHATALLDGGVPALLVVNDDAHQSCEISFRPHLEWTVPPPQGAFCFTGEGLTPISPLRASDGEWRAILPPASFVVFTDRNLFIPERLETSAP